MTTKKPYGLITCIRLTQTELDALSKVQKQLNCSRSAAIRLSIQQALAA